MFLLTFTTVKIISKLKLKSYIKAFIQSNLAAISRHSRLVWTLYSFYIQKSLQRYNSTQFFFGFNTNTAQQEDTQPMFFSLQSTIKIKF